MSKLTELPMPLHNLDDQELAALRQAYAHKHSELATWRGNPEACAICESLCRKNLLRYHRTVQRADGQRFTVYRITREGRLELFPDSHHD